MAQAVTRNPVIARRGGRPRTLADPAQCPYCGYDVRGQLVTPTTEPERCPECGRSGWRLHVTDNVPFLFERHTPLLAFILLPIDLIRLLRPRLRLSRVQPLGAGYRDCARLIRIGVPLWLFSAAMLFVVASLLAKVTFVPGCTSTRTDPFTQQSLSAVGSYVTMTPYVASYIVLFGTGFVFAAFVLAFCLRRLAPAGLRGQEHFLRIHVLRRVVFAFSPVFCLLVLSALLTGAYLASQVDHEDVGDTTPNDVTLYFIIAAFLIRLMRAGYADDRTRGVGAYLACGGLAILSWFVWVMALGGILTGKNLHYILHMLYLRGN